MQTFAVRDLCEHTSARVRNAEAGAYSVVSRHGKPLFVAVPFTDALLDVWPAHRCFAADAVRAALLAAVGE